MPDGNAYNLINLAIENFVDKYIVNDEDDEEFETIDKNKERYDIIIFLVKTQLENYPNDKVDCSMRKLIDVCDKYDDYTLVTILFRIYNISTWDMYHYSIAWGYFKVFDNLIEKFNDIIDLEWTYSALKIAERFGLNKDSEMFIHVQNKIIEINEKKESLS